ncbi:MAG: hypothetical protein WCD00_11425 [Desulfuromonadaceae bacterium]
MTPLAHVGFSTPLAALIAWQASPEAAACFAGGAVLIDLDHFIFYALRTGRYNPLEMFDWFRESDKKCTPESYYGLHIFHAAEPFILATFAANYWPILSWLLLGMGFHLLLDLFWLYSHPVLSLKVRALSWTEHYIRRIRGEQEFWRNL